MSEFEFDFDVQNGGSSTSEFAFDFDARYNAISISKIEKTSTSGLIDTYTITYSDETTSTFEVANGEQGLQGVQGITGEKGEQGERGYQGNRGEQGLQGIQGIKGDQGSQGEKGDKGDTGLQGETYELTTQDKLEIAELTQDDATNIFNQNVENQTSVFNQNALEKLDNVSTAVDDYVGEYDNLETQNKLNLVDATNEVNSIAKDNSTELEKARVSFLGEMYDSIYERLRADFLDVYNRFNKASLVPYSSSCINAKNSYVGLCCDTIIKGVTNQVGESMQSVEGDLTIQTVGKNLQKDSIILPEQSVGWCDALGFKSEEDSGKTSTSVWLKADSVVTIKISGNYNLKVIQLRKVPVAGQSQQVVGLSINGTANTITINDDGYYTIKAYILNPGETYFGNIMFEVDEVGTDFENYKVDSITYSDVALRSLPNGVCDTIENGTLIQRVGTRDYVDADDDLSTIYTDGETTLYELDDYVVTEIDSKVLRTYDGTTNIFSSGTDVQPIISTNVASNVNAIVAELAS